MKKHLGYCLTILLVATLILTSCNKDDKSSTPEESSPTISEESSEMEEPVPTSTVLPNIDASNYPRIDGSTANIPLLSSLYSKVCDVSLDKAETMMQVSGGTGAVWRNMMYEGADLLVVYEAPENVKAEMEKVSLLEKFDIVPLGRDGLVFLANAKNPVESLTREQLLDIYTGVITDWSEVGGESGPIAPFQRNLESGSQTLFMALLMKDTTPMEPPSELRPAGMGELIDSIAEYDGAGGSLGYSVFYYANLMYENPDLKLLSVDGVKPSTESIMDNSYPLVNDFYVVIRKDEPEDSPARQMRDWLLTDEGRQLLVDAGYVPAT